MQRGGGSASTGMVLGGWASFGSQLLTEGQVINGELLLHDCAWDRDGDAHGDDAASDRGFASDEHVLRWNGSDWDRAVCDDGGTACLEEFHSDLLRVLLLKYRETHILVG